MVKSKRVFLVCRSKNCQEAKRSGIRCTISQMSTTIDEITKTYAKNLNARRLCILYTTDTIINASNTPNWCVSNDKPGKRKLAQKAKEDDQKFYTENPDFLEV